MAKPAPNTPWAWQVSAAYVPSIGINIPRVIDLNHVDVNLSSIDKFIQKNSDLNKLLIDSNQVKGKLLKLQKGRRLRKVIYDNIIQFIDDPANISPVLANLIVLGHISAVESYFREIFRKIILIDSIAQQSCREKLVSYGATLIHTKEALPDAILENTTFSGAYNVAEALREFIGIKGNLPNGLSTALTQYSKVCHLRHCIVHRFGNLGVNNAIKLDWDTHKLHVDKPIKIDFTGLQEVALICVNIVKEANTFIWNTIMTRQIADLDGNSIKKKNSVEWTWNWAQDQKRFKKYYNIFYSTIQPPTNQDITLAYNNYKTKYQQLT